MSAYGTYILILEKTIQKFLENNDPSLRRVGQFLKDNIKLALLGSFGPDLFYSTRDSLKDIEKYVGTPISILTFPLKVKSKKFKNTH